MLLTIILQAVLYSCVAPEKRSTTFLFEQTKLEQAIKFEQSAGSVNMSISEDIYLSESIYPLLDDYFVEFPLVVKRKDNDYLPLQVEYNFTGEDSLLRFVSYDWEIGRGLPYDQLSRIWKKESSKLDEYNNEYERLKQNIIEQLGKPISEDRQPALTKSNSLDKPDYYTRTTTWETGQLLARFKLIFESQSYRIRFSYYWKN